MFYCWCFFVCFWHFAAPYVRAASADHRVPEISSYHLYSEVVFLHPDDIAK